MSEQQIFITVAIGLASLAAGCIYAWSRIVHPPQIAKGAAAAFLGMAWLLLLGGTGTLLYGFGFRSRPFWLVMACGLAAVFCSLLLWRAGWRPQLPFKRLLRDDVAVAMGAAKQVSSATPRPPSLSSPASATDGHALILKDVHLWASATASGDGVLTLSAKSLIHTDRLRILVCHSSWPLRTPRGPHFPAPQQIELLTLRDVVRGAPINCHFLSVGPPRAVPMEGPSGTGLYWGPEDANPRHEIGFGPNRGRLVFVADDGTTQHWYFELHVGMKRAGKWNMYVLDGDDFKWVEKWKAEV